MLSAGTAIFACIEAFPWLELMHNTIIYQRLRKSFSLDLGGGWNI